MSKRPKAKPKLQMVAFKIDTETKAALDRLVAKATLSIVKLIKNSGLIKNGGLRSAVLRQLIIEADRRVK